MKSSASYPSVHVEHSLRNKDAVFYLYKQLICLRENREYWDVIVLDNYLILYNNKLYKK